MEYPSIIVFVFIKVIVLYSSVESVDSDFIKNYTAKICASAPTCNLTSSSALDAASLTLSKRDCMCDSECVEYGDCCKDSRYHGSVSPTENKYVCIPVRGNNYYMVVNCASDFTDKNIKGKCARAVLPLEENDIAVPIPVTNLVKRITYANAYCALCNYDTDFEKWTIYFGCAEPPAGYFDRRAFQMENDQSYIASNSNAKSLSLNFYAYAAKVNELLKIAKYNATVRELTANYEGKQLVCKIGSSLPKSLNRVVRKCVKNLISDCPYDNNNLCKSYFQVVSDNETRKSYQNKDCAICNGADPKALTGCPLQDRTAASGLFSSSGKGSPENDVCRNKQLAGKFC